jgi:hypothetical protein
LKDPAVSVVEAADELVDEGEPFATKAVLL